MESDGTILARVNRSGNSGGIFSRNNGDSWVGQRMVIFLREGSNRWGWSLADGTIGEEFDFAAFPADTWTDLALSWDGSTIATYLNTAMVHSQAQNVNLTPEVTGLNTWIGRTDLGDPEAYFCGLIDEVLIFNRALTPEDVRNNQCAQEALAGTDPLPLVCRGGN